MNQYTSMALWCERVWGGPGMGAYQARPLHKI